MAFTTVADRLCLTIELGGAIDLGFSGWPMGRACGPKIERMVQVSQSNANLSVNQQKLFGNGFNLCATTTVRFPWKIQSIRERLLELSNTCLYGGKST